MEDILASIRRILDEDQTAPVAAAESPGPAAEDEELLLDESMLVEVARPALPEPPLNRPQVAAETRPMPPPTETDPYSAFTPSLQPQHPAGGLLASASADIAASSMASLVRAVSVERGTAVYRNGPTIEELVREELRPLLKSWLDNHLPPLVERLVRTEIERVVSRADA